MTVEFTMMMPVLITLMLASVEAPAFLAARAGVADAAGAIGDLTSQSVAINEDAADVIFLAADQMINPGAGGVEGLTARLTSALVCRCDPGSDRFCFTTIWSHGYAEGELTQGYAQGSELPDISERIGLTENETVIVAEASFEYVPRLTGALKVSPIRISDTVYYRPRRSREVTHLGAFSTDTPMVCDEGNDGPNPDLGGEGGEGHEDQVEG